ncbi:MAG: zinc ABC transporter substrate-binding protein [Chloroflexi bacterium]|nr:zinc ABC transporter substrate-binding protein [Chloroflexota bacterium]
MLRGLRRFTPVPLLLLAAALVAAAIVACGDDDDDEEAGAGATDATTAPAASEPLKVVTSTGILAHFAQQVAGDDAEVVAVIPAGADTHTFSASTGDIRNIAAADVVIVNGFNLEEGTLATIFEHIPDDARLVIAAAGIKPLEGGHHDDEDDHGDEEEGDDHDEGDDDHGDEDEDEGEDHGDEEEEGEHHDEDEEEEGDDHGDEDEGEGHDEDEGEDHGDEDHEKAEAPAGAELAVADGDPHMWLTVPNAMVYVRNIADGLAAADPDNAAAYRERSEAYLAELQALDEEVRAAVAGIPQERRVLIVYHDAFQYFAVEYGLELAAAVLPASPSQQASAAAVAEIIEIVEEHGVGAVYREPQFAADALDAIAEEAGVGVLVLYSGAFTDEIDTYVDLMRFNARSLVEGLGGG